MQNSGFTVATTDCGVTPQAQNTGISSSLIGTASPQSGLAMSLMPISSGLPRCTGAPCTAGKRVVICTARIALAGLNGRIETTMGPANGPAAPQAMLVRYIGTRTLSAICLIGSPSASSASSNENEQPSTKATRSSPQYFLISVGSSTTSPSRQTR